MTPETPISRPSDVSQPDAALQDAGVDEGGADTPDVDASSTPDAADETDAVTSTSDEGAETSDEPVTAADEPTPTSDESAPASDEPTPAADDSVSAADQPAPASEEPAAASDEPSAASDEPTPLSDEPAAASGEPAPISADSASASAPTPRPVPRPSSGPRPVPRPGAGPRPGATAPRPGTGPARTPRPAPTGLAAEPWGRVADDGTVSVREAAGWRVVGEYPDGTPAEALAYFERRYADLQAEVRLLEDRHSVAGTSPADLRTTADALRARLVDAAAVGDLASLVARLDLLDGTLAERTRAQSAAVRAAVDEALRERTQLVERIEALAQRDPATIQWKQTTADVTALFDEWQRQQQSGARLPKAASQALWKRFRDARAAIDRLRREFYADLDAVHKVARDAKTRLVEQAEALRTRGEDGIGTYRELLDRWKSAGRAGKKADDALWVRFKAAGDALYAARGDRESAEAEASKERIETRRALLDEAKGVAAERDLPKARALLTSIQRRWDDTGRIFPRETERALDDDLRKIEQALRSREDADWRSNDPTTKARANDMTRQLEEAITKLEAEVAAAKKSGDAAAEKRATEALAARRSWLGVVGR